MVTSASDGAEGLELARSYEFDVIVLDIMMPKLSGYEMAKRLRAEKVRTPILMLTARDAVPDIVRGLDLGADDYMTKPFSFDELIARLRAVKRRSYWVVTGGHMREIILTAAMLAFISPAQAQGYVTQPGRAPAYAIPRGDGTYVIPRH